MKINDNKGISIIALILIVIVLIIIIRFGIESAKEKIEETKLEDIKTTMLLIQGKAKTISDKVKFKDENAKYIGTKIEDTAEFSYLTNEKGKYYKLVSSDLETMGIKGIELKDGEYYIVDYSTCEIYYPLGYKEKYTLTEIQELEESLEGNNIIGNNVVETQE